MAIQTTDSKHYQNIAQAIRDKIGTNLKYLPEEMAAGVADVFDAGTANGYESGYEAGKAEGGGAEDLLAAYQENGNRINYNVGFAGIGWTQEIYDKLPYPVTIEGGWYGFGYSKVKRLTNVSFVQRNGLATMACCYGCDQLEEVGNFDLYYDSDVRNFFYNCRKLRKIGRFVFPSATYLHAGNHTNIFYNCESLEEINVAGTIDCYDVSFKQSTKLSKASIESIYAALTTEGGAAANTLTLSLTAVNKAFETSEGANDGSTSEEWENLYLNTPWRTVLG